MRRGDAAVWVRLPSSSAGCEFSTRGEGTAPDAATRSTTRGEKDADLLVLSPHHLAKVSLERTAERCAGLCCCRRRRRRCRTLLIFTNREDSTGGFFFYFLFFCSSLKKSGRKSRLDAAWICYKRLPYLSFSPPLSLLNVCISPFLRAGAD